MSTMTVEEQRGCMETLQLAGQLIVENGGEIFRVEETITRMGRAFGLSDVEAFAVPSGVFISYRLSDGSEESAVKRLHAGDMNLARVDEVNAISRRVEKGELTRAQALDALKGIRVEKRSVSGPVLAAGAGLCAAGFALVFGGGWKEFLAAGAVGLLCRAVLNGFSQGRLNGTVQTLLGGMLSALGPMLLSLLVPLLNLEVVIAGALMPLLPGLTMTNAVQDTVRGDVMAGVSHGMQALFTACAAAGGALLAAGVFGLLTGGGLV